MIRWGPPPTQEELDEEPKFGHLIDENSTCTRCKKPLHSCIGADCICQHCGMEKKDHAENGKCLFESTTYKG